MQHINVVGLIVRKGKQVKHRCFAAIPQEATGQNWKIENVSLISLLATADEVISANKMNS